MRLYTIRQTCLKSQETPLTCTDLRTSQFLSSVACFCAADSTRETALWEWSMIQDEAMVR